MDKPFKNPEHGIKVIDVAIGHLAECTNDCNAQIQRLKKVRVLLGMVEDGSWIELKDAGIDNLEYLYKKAIEKASEKVGKHVRVFEHESNREDYKSLFEEDGSDTAG